jgi:hypothetical protein
MAGGIQINSPSLGGIVRSTRTAGPARGASAINAAARAKTAAYQANRGSSTAVDNNTADVTGIVGPNPIRQPAYETQAQTLMEQNFKGAQNGLDRTHESAQQAAELAARQKELEAKAAADRGEMELAAKLGAEAESRRLSAATRIMSSSSGPTGPQVDGGGGPAGKEDAARNAAFARAKERAGQTALAALTSLKDVMAGAGKMGSSMESQGIASIIGGAAGDVNEFSRDELILDTNRAADIADRNYAGAITQRGQDQAAKLSLLSLIGKGGAY